ncbi:MAG: heparinase II/III family protein [Actinobacteria bacterium]|nr:heparinase II/III family protein [Actinomycetota bacterium]
MRPSQLIYALRTARPRQLRARALRPVRRRRFGSGEAPQLSVPAAPTELWRSPAFEPTQLAGQGPERLRQFHGHYGEDVLAAARAGDLEVARRTMEAWMGANPPRPGDAWHPYTTSTRVGNWIAALGLEPSLESTRVRESLWRQLIHVEKNVEDDVLGNHVIRNARALILGGSAFGAQAFIARGVELLERELPEQVLADGGHYERSPVYHLIVLRDLLEIGAVIDHAEVAAAAERMRLFAAALSRPDGAPALFNDGTLDLAPVLRLPEPPEGLSVFPETGYAVLRRGGLWLAFDCGPASPPFLPAHAHADALSFQLWLDGRPIVVDPGMPTYEAGRERNWFRGTTAHSTVAIDGGQFELWGAFRSGPLPQVELLEASERELAASVVGKGGVRHTRRIGLRADALLVHDTLEGKGEHDVVSSLPFAPRVEAPAEPFGLSTATTEARIIAERLYTRVRGSALVTRRRGQLPTEAGWSLEI